MIESVPEADIEISDKLVRNLVDKQFSEFAHLEISSLNSGWDNVIYKLGSDFLIRLPRREVSAPLLLNEAKWLPKITDKLPLLVPSPIKIGKANSNYPYMWSIIPWINGQTADMNTPDENEIFNLVKFLQKLHIINLNNLPYNPYRSVPLEKNTMIL